MSSANRCLPWVSFSGNATPPLPIVVHDVAGSRSTTDWLPLTAFSAWLDEGQTGPVLCCVPLLLMCFSKICYFLYMNICIWCGVCKCLWCHQDWVWFFWKKVALFIHSWWYLYNIHVIYFFVLLLNRPRLVMWNYTAIITIIHHNDLAPAILTLPTLTSKCLLCFPQSLSFSESVVVMWPHLIQETLKGYALICTISQEGLYWSNALLLCHCVQTTM